MTRAEIESLGTKIGAFITAYVELISAFMDAMESAHSSGLSGPSVQEFADVLAVTLKYLRSQEYLEDPKRPIATT